MNIEQERADFESWLYLDQTKYDPERMSEQEIEIAKIAYQAGRAALQSKPIESAAREIALWAYGEVGADPELTPGLAQLLHHFGILDDVPVALQSQDKEDAERYRWLRDSDCFYDLPYEDHGLGPEFPIGEALDSAIDHARRVEGGGE